MLPIKRTINKVLTALSLKSNSKPDSIPILQPPYTVEIKRSDLLLLYRKIDSKAVKYFDSPNGLVCQTVSEGALRTWGCEWGYAASRDGYCSMNDANQFSDKEKTEQAILMAFALQNQDEVITKIIEDGSYNLPNE